MRNMHDSTPMRTLDVSLGERSYPIHIGAGILDRAGELVAPHLAGHAVIVTNATVARHWLAPLRTQLSDRGVRVDVVLIADGETHKNLATLGDVLTRLIECHAERRTRSPNSGANVSLVTSIAVRPARLP